MKVLVACEESQAVTKAFRAVGIEAWSCDLQPCSGGHPEWHIQNDVLEVINEGWDMMIAHPECKYLCLSGACWFGHPDYPDRYDNFEKGIEFFIKLWEAPIERICIENSQPLGRTIQRVGRYDQCVQPWMLGEPYTKGAYLWLKNLNPIVTTHVQSDYDEIYDYAHKLGPSEDRSKLRAKTYPCIAEAMAMQWGLGVEPEWREGLFATGAMQ